MVLCVSHDTNKMFVKKFFLLVFLQFANARLNFEIANTAFDQQLYEDVLDAEECDRQLNYLQRNAMLALSFAEAGIRFPRGLLQGNNVDLGNYHQCLGINHALKDMQIQGKYCMIEVPMNQSFNLPPELEFTDWAQLNILKNNYELFRKIGKFDRIQSQLRTMSGIYDRRTRSVESLLGIVLRLAVCIPKPCTTQQAMNSFMFNLTNIGFKYEDDFCRLPNDKPWHSADFVAIAVFSLIGLLTILSTSYDLYYTFHDKIDRNQLSVMYTSFSVYTNGKRLMHFPSSPGNLQCLDGIRSLSMAWIILGHTVGSYKFFVNRVDGLLNWLISLEAIWILSSFMAVDTFFTIAGVLIVYTTAGKMNGMKLLKNLHLFYLNRLLRMFPVLATVVLLQASYFNRMSDGPTWTTVSRWTNNCRTFWWSTLLHVQNLLNPSQQCISHSWYIAIDVQLYIVSPVVLFWVLNGKRSAWVALTLGLLAVLVSSTVYNFINNFQPATILLNRPAEDLRIYLDNYYFFTFTRAAPFFVGMLFGYILHLHRNNKVDVSWLFASFMWMCSLTVTTIICFHIYFIMQLDWDSQLVDNLINSFLRPAWGCALCWMIFACVHGYGGPINWFLSLDVWKLPARLSYAMYLFHYPVMFIICDTTSSTNFFSIPFITFQFLAHITLSIIIAYLVTLLIDSPFSTIFKKLVSPTSTAKPKRPLSRLIGEDKEKLDTNGDANGGAEYLNANSAAETGVSNEVRSVLNGESHSNKHEGKDDAKNNGDINLSGHSKDAPKQTVVIDSINETESKYDDSDRERTDIKEARNNENK